MSSTIAGCLYLTCASCRRKKFAPADGRMSATDTCHACEVFGPRPTKALIVQAKTADPEPGPVNPHGVAPGQKWRSLDKRQEGRIVEILDLEGDRAIVLSHGTGGVKRRKVRLDQFRPHKGRGFELVPG